MVVVMEGLSDLRRWLSVAMTSWRWVISDGPSYWLVVGCLLPFVVLPSMMFWLMFAMDN
jgi:hypothetical protein